MTTYSNVKNMIKQHLKNDENKDYYGFNYIFMIMKTVYGKDIYKNLENDGNRNLLLSKFNELLEDYNNTYLGTESNLGKWVNKELSDVCNPNNQNYYCNPRDLLGLQSVGDNASRSRLSGNLRVKNKDKEKCSRKCGPDCSDGCFFTPSISEISIENTKYFSDIFEPCSCIPCFEYIKEDGDITCFQSTTVPNILETMLNNFKIIYAATKDSNPRTAYYIFSDDFDNEYDVKEDIRLVVKIIEEFINNCRNPLNSDVQNTCQENKNTRNAADPNCNNSEKIFCKNINRDIETTNIYNCINDEHSFPDVIKDNINFALNPTEINHCYCQEINPIDGNVIETDENNWMSRDKCKNLNFGGENFHICSDDSYSNELIKELKIIKSKCQNDQSLMRLSQLCNTDNEIIDSKNYESYLFNYEYQNNTIDNCSNDDIYCISYSKGLDKTTVVSDPNTDPNTDPNNETNFIEAREKIKDHSIYRYATKDYCHCVHKDDTAQCNTWGTCYGDAESEDNIKDTCSNVHASIFGDEGIAQQDTSTETFDKYISMDQNDKILAKYNIIDRNICEINMKCLGYVCENGGYDNSFGGLNNNNDSNMSYLRNIIYPLIPSYTGLSLKYTLPDQIATPLNSNDQSVDFDTSGLMEKLGYEKKTVTQLANETLCDYGKTFNQYASIDARAATIEDADMKRLSSSIWQALNPISYASCLGEEINTALSHISTIETPDGRKCSTLASADSGFFGNMTSYVSDYFNSVEDSVVASSLSTVGDTLTGFSCTTDDNARKPITIDYGYIRNNLVYLAAIILFLISIPTLGPIAFLLAIIITISWHIYDKMVPDKTTLEDLTDGEASGSTYGYLVLMIIFIFFIIYTSKNKTVRSGLYNKSINVVYEMKDDLASLDIFD